MSPVISINKKQDAFVRTRIDSTLKKEAEEIFEFIGISPSQAIKMFYQQVKLNHGIPFEMKLPQETIDAMDDVLNKRNLTEYSNKKELFKALGF